MNRKRIRTWRPRLEALESRWCPACDVSLIGSTLLVTGDSADNEVAIVNDGSGVVHVEADTVTRDFTETIDRVIVRTGAGNDSVFVSDNDFEFVGGISRHWLIDLGQGDDEAGVFLFGLLDAPASVTMLCGAGNDIVSLSPVGSFESTFVGTVSGGDGDDFIFNLASGDLNETMVVSLLGGSGDDNIFDFYDAFRVHGAFIGLADGGSGSDVMGAGFGSFTEFDPNLPLIVFGFDVSAGGHANYAMLGGNGDDTLRASSVGRIDGQFGLLIDGGNGADETSAGLGIHVESTGQFAAIVRGGYGDDHLLVQVFFFETELIELPDLPGVFVEALAGISETPAPLSSLVVVGDGGRGFDSCSHSNWVTLFGIEDDQPL